MEHVPYLLTVPVDRDRTAKEGRDHEVGCPTLILYAKLALAVDATLPEDHGAQPVDACVVAHILITATLGDAIGGVEVEWLLLGHPVRHVAVGVARGLLNNGYVLHPTVDFIR